MAFDVTPRNAAKLAFEAFLDAENESADIATGIAAVRECSRAFAAMGEFPAALKYDELGRLYRELGGDPDGETTADAIRLSEIALERS